MFGLPKKLERYSLPLLTAAWLFLIIGLILLGISPISDSDVFMHLALGREFFRNGSLPLTDPFIVSQFRDWAAWHEWGGYALMYLVYSLLGYAGLIGLKLFLAGSALFPSYRALRKSDLLTSWPQFLICLCGVIALGLRFSARTSLIADALLALTIAIVLADSQSGSSSRKIWLLPPLILLWINVHSSFPLAWAALGIWIISCFVARGWGEMKRAVLVFIVCVLVPLLNPQGLEGVLAPFRVLRLKQEYMQHLILEWNPTFSPSMLGFMETWLFAAFLILSSLLILISLKQGMVRQKIIYAFLAVFLVALGFSANRFIPGVVFGLILVTCSIPIRTRALGIKLNSCLAIISLSFVFFILSGQYRRAGLPHQIGVGVDYRVFPNEETIQIIKNMVGDGPLRNDFYFGCYLAWMLDGQPKIFVHGYVTDMRVLQEHFSGFGQSREHFDLDAQKWGTGGVLLRRDSRSSKLFELLSEHPRWFSAATDEASILFLPRASRVQ